MSDNFLFNELEKLSTYDGNHCAFVVGAPGTGVPYLLKSEIIERFREGGRTQMLVLDTAGDYLELSSATSAGIIRPQKPESRINLLTTLAPQNRIFTEAVLLAFVEAAAGTLKEADADILRSAYADALTKTDKPTLQNIAEILKNHPDKAAQRLYTVLEIYFAPSFELSQYFNCQSSERDDHRVTVYELDQMTGVAKILMLFTCISDMINKMIKNHEQGVNTFIYLSEINLFTNRPYASQLLRHLCGRAKDFGAVVVLSARDFIKAELCQAGLELFQNTSLLLALGLMPVSRHDLDEVFELTPGSCPSASEHATYLHWNYAA